MAEFGTKVGILKFVCVNPYWQISETKSKNWVFHRASFSETNPTQISADDDVTCLKYFWYR